MAVVHDGHQRLDLLQVLGVLGHVLPRRHQLRDERDALAELRVLLEEQVERGEAAQHVLRQVRAVHAQDQVVAPAAQDLGSYSWTSARCALRMKLSAEIGSG